MVADSTAAAAAGVDKGASNAEPIPRSQSMIAQLNAEQKAAVDAFQSGSNTFLTGGAGVGKTFVLHTIIELLKERYTGGCAFQLGPSGSHPPPHDCNCYQCRVSIVGPTGLSVLPLSGRTLNGFLGIGLGRTLGEWDRAPSSLHQRRMRTARVLILEEISTVSAEAFDLVDQRMHILTTAKDGDPAKAAPFGGRVQLLIVGDFLQLPPVENVDPTSAEDVAQCEDKYHAFRASYRALLREYFPSARASPQEFALLRRQHRPRGRMNKLALSDVSLRRAFDQTTKLYQSLPVRGWGCAFQSNVWSKLGLRVVSLKQPMRFCVSRTATTTSDSATAAREEEEHRAFLVALNQLRVGDRAAVQFFETRVNAAATDDMVHLVYTNLEAQLRNTRQLRRLLRDTGVEAYEFRHLTLRAEASAETVSNVTAIEDDENEHVVSSEDDMATSSHAHFSQAVRTSATESEASLLMRAEEDSSDDRELNDMAPPSLPLCIGAPVLLTRNLDLRPTSQVPLVNGSRGCVVGWQSVREAVRTLDAGIRSTQERLASASERPEEAKRLRYFLATLEAKRRFLIAPGEPGAPFMHAHLPDALPIVRFTGTCVDEDGNTVVVERDEPILPALSVLRDATDSRRRRHSTDDVVLHKWRLQLPLRLGWALTVHRRRAPPSTPATSRTAPGQHSRTVRSTSPSLACAPCDDWCSREDSAVRSTSGRGRSSQSSSRTSSGRRRRRRPDTSETKRRCTSSG